MDFATIEELYSYLETNTNKIKRQWELTIDFKKLSESIHDESQKEKIKWESFVFDFDLSDGKVKPAHSTTRENGSTIYAYPSYDEFGDSGHGYLKQRAQIVKNDFLIVRYNQVLWNSPTKHKNSHQAKAAIEGYLRILSCPIIIEIEKIESWERLRLFKNGFGLALQVKYRIEDFKVLLHSWLFDKGKFKNDTKILLINYMLDLPQSKK